MHRLGALGAVSFLFAVMAAVPAAAGVPAVTVVPAAVDGPAASVTVSVTISQQCGDGQPFCYSPANVTVADGTTVVWTNQTDTGHTVNRCDPSACPGTSGGTGTDTGFSSTGFVVVQPGGSFRHTFSGAGTYNYYCAIHGYALMHGTVTVEAPPTTTAPPTTAPATAPTTSSVSTGTMPTTAGPTVAPTANAQAVSSPQLARTGSSPRLAATAALLVGIGLVLAVPNRRRRRNP